MKHTIEIEGLPEGYEVKNIVFPTPVGMNRNFRATNANRNIPKPPAQS